MDRTVLKWTVFVMQGIDEGGSTDPENFGDFFLALFSLWQISTGDDWSIPYSPRGRENLLLRG
jgi:hypothetical protein